MYIQDNYSPITLTHTLTGAVTTATRRWSYRVAKKFGF